MESPCIGCLVEVEVTAEYFISSFAAQYHLDTHALDNTCQQIHRGRGADGGDIVSFDVIDDIADGIQSFLNGVVDFVVDGSDKIGYFTCFGQVG